MRQTFSDEKLSAKYLSHISNFKFSLVGLTVLFTKINLIIKIQSSRIEKIQCPLTHSFLLQFIYYKVVGPPFFRS